jgi:hypothetical protein
MKMKKKPHGEHRGEEEKLVFLLSVLSVVNPNSSA